MHLCVNGVYYTDIGSRIAINDVLRKMRELLTQLEDLRRDRTVYVDEPRWPCGRMLMAHMWSPDTEALHALAAQLGLKRAWFQDRPGFAHYDISKGKRAEALKLGAVAVSSRELVRLKRESEKRV